jgi:hypothetical protein
MTFMNFADSSKILARLARTELMDDLGLKLQVDFGNDFWNALFYGTLKTFVERVDANGFCQTSYGEENNVKCYGEVHYPRDASEAARALADCGFVESAIRILEFNLNHIPEGQYYLPHVFFRDGSIKANTIQVDTPAHVANALARCVELAGTSERLRKLFLKMDEVMAGTWQHHFHEDLNLLDAGNYNEQGFGGGAEPICDLFTNTSMARAMLSMAKLAEVFGKVEISSKYRSRYEQLNEGIEKHLFDPMRKVYSIKYDLTTGQQDTLVNWMSLYCRRWYAGNPEAWENTFDILQKNTTLDWDGMRVITGLADRYEVLGKVYAQMLAYLGRSGRFKMLSEHMTFAEKTIRRPSNIYPERWYYKRPEPFGEYHQWFFSHFEGIWDAYRDNPNGDYTIDSGNCEQAAVFLSHLVEDLLGIRAEDGFVSLWPKLPFEFTHISIKNVPVKQNGNEIEYAGYELDRKKDQLSCRIETRNIAAVELTLAMPEDAKPVSVNVNGQPLNDYSVRKENDVRWFSFKLRSAGMSHVELKVK